MSFAVTIKLPSTYHFPLRERYEKNQKRFIEEWLSGALSTIVTGPLVPVREPHTGAIKGIEVIVALME